MSASSIGAHNRPLSKAAPVDHNASVDAQSICSDFVSNYTRRALAAKRARFAAQAAQEADNLGSGCLVLAVTRWLRRWGLGDWTSCWQVVERIWALLLLVSRLSRDYIVIHLRVVVPFCGMCRDTRFVTRNRRSLSQFVICPRNRPRPRS